VWDDLVGWLGGLGDEYGVDPLVYAVLYVASAPLFFGSLAWLIRRLRRREEWLVPGASTALFFSLPTLYVVVAGRDLPWWIYAVLIGVAALGLVGAMRRVRSALRR
jgi:peptidoglycan/LPS O-acetylase OafA/YrhL